MALHSSAVASSSAVSMAPPCAEKPLPMEAPSPNLTAALSFLPSVSSGPPAAPASSSRRKHLKSILPPMAAAFPDAQLVSAGTRAPLGSTRCFSNGRNFWSRARLKSRGSFGGKSPSRLNLIPVPKAADW